LNVFDISKQVLKFRIRLTQHRHPREVTDIALVVAAGIERQHVALLPALFRRRAVVARAAGNETIFKRQPAIDLLAFERIGKFLLGGAGTVAGHDGHH